MAYAPINPRTESTVANDGVAWFVQTADKPYSLSIVDNNYRFEVRDGDRCGWIGDTAPKERSELSCSARTARRQRLTVSADLLLEPGPASQRHWLDVLQIHPFDVPGQVASACLALFVPPSTDGKTEILNVGICSAGPDKVPGTTPPSTMLGYIPFTRGVMHHVGITFVDDFGGPNGLVTVTWNGDVMVDRAQIQTAYAYETGTAGSYAKFGIYTATSPDPADTGLVLHVQNPTVRIS